jgi:hypothetical protein
MSNRELRMRSSPLTCARSVIALIDQAFGVHNEIRGGHTRYGKTFQPCSVLVTFEVVIYGAVEVTQWNKGSHTPLTKLHGE